MSGPGPWAPLLLWLLLAAPGRPHLAPPRNVMLLSQNFSVYLTWLPGLGSTQNVTYIVAYESSPIPRKWRRVRRCAGTRALVCPLMCVKKQDLYNKFKARVQAASASARSAWVESRYLDYLCEVEPAAPILVFTRTEKILTVNATYQLPPCMPPVDLKYEVEFWKEGAGNKTLFPATAHGQPVQVPLQPATSGRHCLSARTIYTFILPKYSNFSTPTCFFLEAPGPAVPWYCDLVVLNHFLRKQGQPGSGDLQRPAPAPADFSTTAPARELAPPPALASLRRPRELNFSGFRHSVATFQSREPEFTDDLFLCIQKELTRKVRLAPQVRDPAILQAESEGSTEDEDDNIIFQPYIERRAFPRPEPQVSGHSEAEESGVDMGGPWTPVVSGGSWDSSDRSWPSTVDSSWDEAGSSSYLAKKGLIPGLSGDQHPEPPSHPEFSEDSGSLEQPLQDDLSLWATWGASSPGRNLLPGKPQVLLQTLTFCWDSSEEEEGEGEREVEAESSSTGSLGAGSCPRTKVRSVALGDYLAR